MMKPCKGKLSRHKQSRQGFTLIEIIFVVLIFSIIVALATPPLLTLIEQNKSATVSNTYMNAIRFARTHAILKQETITLCGSSNAIDCDNQWQNGVIVFADINKNRRLDNNETKLYQLGALAPTSSLTWRSFQNKGYLQFLPTGLTYYQNGSFTYCPANPDLRFARQWIINRAGRIYLARDKNGDGIAEGANGKNIQCPYS